jgi:hypothetical protein
VRYQYLVILALGIATPVLAQQKPHDANAPQEIDAMARSGPSERPPTAPTAVTFPSLTPAPNDPDVQFDLLIRELTGIPKIITARSPEYNKIANIELSKTNTNLEDFRVFFDLIYSTKLEIDSIDFSRQKYGDEFYRDLANKNIGKNTESEKFISGILKKDAAYYLNYAAKILQEEFTVYNFRYKYSESQNKKAFELMKYLSKNEDGKKLINHENFFPYLLDCLDVKTQLAYCKKLEKSESIKKLNNLPNFDVFSTYIRAAVGQTIRAMVTRFNGGVHGDRFLSTEKLKGTGLKSPYPDLPVKTNNDQ